jgi:hypothetical protein
MIAENDPGSGVYIAGRTDKERDVMARKIHEPGPDAATSGYTPVFNHVMVDIETMSLHRHRALILSAGLVEFDPNDKDKLHIGQSALLTPYIMPQIMLGRRVDVGTQKFWADEARKEPRAAAHFLDPSNLIHVETFIRFVRAFCKDKPNVWANGTQFDLSNLDGLAEDIGDTEPLWHYQAPRDMRTFMKTTSQTRLVPIGDALDIPGVPHDPVYDCISQAYRVWGNWNA